jgi:hypothetical protein
MDLCRELESFDCFDAVAEIGLQIVMAWHFMAIAAFFVQSDPGAPPHVDIFDAHLARRGAHAREGEGFPCPWNWAIFGSSHTGGSALRERGMREASPT